MTNTMHIKSEKGERMVGIDSGSMAVCTSTWTGNVCLCVHLSVCLSVCLSVSHLTRLVAALPFVCMWQPKGLLKSQCLS